MREVREATRELKGLTGTAEKRLLVWLAARLPPAVNSDHLTALGLLAMIGAGGAYALTRRNPAWLHAVNVLLVVNWFGDSLDGTLARHRNRLRPRYGFYVDHIVDMYGFLALLAGLAISPYMSIWVALGLLVVYYMLSIHIYLSTYTEGVFKIAYGKVGGTELRIILIAGSLALSSIPMRELAGRAWLLYDMRDGRHRGDGGDAPGFHRPQRGGSTSWRSTVLAPMQVRVLLRRIALIAPALTAAVRKTRRLEASRCPRSSAGVPAHRGEVHQKFTFTASRSTPSGGGGPGNPGVGCLRAAVSS